MEKPFGNPEMRILGKEERDKFVLEAMELSKKSDTPLKSEGVRVEKPGWVGKILRRRPKTPEQPTAIQ